MPIVAASEFGIFPQPTRKTLGLSIEENITIRGSTNHTTIDTKAMALSNIVDHFLNRLFSSSSEKPSNAKLARPRTTSVRFWSENP